MARSEDCRFEVVRILLLLNFHFHLSISTQDEHQVLASVSSHGHLALWDLNSGGRLLHLIRGAHDAAISAVQWVPGQPILITSGEDNCVKVRSNPLGPCYL